MNFNLMSWFVLLLGFGIYGVQGVVLGPRLPEAQIVNPPTPSQPASINTPSTSTLWVSSVDESQMNGFAPEQLLSSTAEQGRYRFTPSGKIANLAFDAAGNLWLVNMEKDQLEEYALESLISTTPSPSRTIYNLPSPTDAAFDASGNLWVAHATGELLKFSPTQLTGADRALDSTEALLHIDLEPLVTSLAFDDDGNLWYTREGTVLRLKAEQLEQGSATPEQFFQTDAHTYRLAFDETGNLWLATSPGLLKFPRDELSRGALGDQHPLKASLILSSLGPPFDLAFDEQGNLWMGLITGGVVRLSAASLSQTGNHVAVPDLILTNPGTYPYGLAFWPIPPNLPLGKAPR